MRQVLRGSAVTVGALLLGWGSAGSARAEGAEAELVKPQAELELRQTGAPRRGRALWIGSICALAGATIADAGSSWRKGEANGFLAGDGGRFGARGAMLKGGVTGLWMATQALAVRRNSAHRVLAIVNFAVSSVLFVVAYHNRGIPAEGTAR
jgi:hypothetical protein